MPTLLLLRHATAVAFAPGRSDSERPLTDHGHAQAVAVGDLLATTHVDRVLCSPAVRTRQTADGLALACEIELAPALHNAGADTILALISEVDETVGTLLVVGHAPGIPALAQELAGPDSASSALAAIRRGYPPATLVRIEVDGTWADPRATRLVGATLHP
ncbi:MAG: histidine phosphatase family protein [Propionibacteriales bacterium]|nr:histidine phosphatase family protein [Propionibacteriales bacterium]